MNLTKNKYYFEALDCYPYNLADCLEALNYALSYDSEDADALCLMGRIYSEQLRDYEKAIAYFDEAIQHDMTNVNTPQFYISALLNNEDFYEAEKLIDYALKLKGVDKAMIFYYRSVLSEKRGNLKNALIYLKEAKKFSCNQCNFDFLTAREKFVKSKILKKKKTKKKEKEA